MLNGLSFQWKDLLFQGDFRPVNMQFPDYGQVAIGLQPQSADGLRLDSQPQEAEESLSLVLKG